MENITINQKQLFDVIKRTMSFSKEYAIEKLDADGNFIVFINGDFTDFFILRKSIVDYITTKSTVYADLQAAYNKLIDNHKNLSNNYNDLQHISDSYKNDIEILRTANKNLRADNENYYGIKSQYDQFVVSYNQLESNYKYVLSQNEELNSVVKHDKTEIAILKDTIEELRAKIKTQNAIIEINKEKIEKQDKEIQSYKNINKQSESDL